jgi:hypothetical protein
LKITDYKDVGKYEVCVSGKTMVYNRIFFNFIKSTDNLDNKSYLTKCTLPFKINTLWDDITFFLSLITAVFIYTYFSYYFLLFMKLGVQKLRNNN